MDQRLDKMEKWIPSRYNISTPLPEGRSALLNLITGQVKVVNQTVWEEYLQPGTRTLVTVDNVPSQLQRLNNCGFLVTERIDELDLVKLQYQNSRFDVTQQTIVIAPTLDCNLRCTYCFEGGVQESRNLGVMSKETERKVTAYLMALCQDKERLTLSWFGGEPLIASGAIDRICEQLLSFLAKHDVEVDSFLTTNGLLLTPKIVSKLASWGINHCQVTVDIPQDTRRDRAGRVVEWAHVLERVACVIDARIPVKLRINVSAGEEELFDALYRLLLDRGLHDQFDSISFVGVTLPECGRYPKRSSALSSPILYSVIQRERCKARALGLNVPNFLPGIAIPCGATRQNYCVVGPEGELYHCPKDLGLTERAYSSVHDRAAFRPQNLLPWLTYDWFSYPECKSCPILPQCASGCPHMRRYQAQEIKEKGFCPFLRWFFDDGLPEELRAYVLANR